MTAVHPEHLDDALADELLVDYDPATVPTSLTASPAAPTATPAGPATVTRTVTKPGPTVTRTVPGPTVTKTVTRTVTKTARRDYVLVRAGDTLSAIAKAQRVPLATLTRLNPALDPDRVIAGTLIRNERVVIELDR